MRRNDIDNRLAAINHEARRRGMSYGELMSRLDPYEKEQIVESFDRTAAERRRKATQDKHKESKKKR